MELVSIIMPCFNAEAFVGQAIQSVLRQTHSNFELIVVNDGSRDKTKNIIGEFSDPRIRYLEQTNQGVSAARNNGLSVMKGQYFCFLDADDILPPNSLQARLAVFANPNVMFADGSVQIYNEAMSNVIREWKPTIQGKVRSSLIRLDGRCFFGPTWMIRRRQGFTYAFNRSLTHAEDLLFFISIADDGEYAFTNETVLCYRKSSSSAMANATGLADGYTKLRTLIDAQTPGHYFDKLVLSFRSRKIMFLTFLNQGKYGHAFKYLATGSI